MSTLLINQLVMLPVTNIGFTNYLHCQTGPTVDVLYQRNNRRERRHAEVLLLLRILGEKSANLLESKGGIASVVLTLIRGARCHFGRAIA